MGGKKRSLIAFLKNTYLKVGLIAEVFCVVTHRCLCVAGLVWYTSTVSSKDNHHRL